MSRFTLQHMLDGEPIKVGDTVYIADRHREDGTTYNVLELVFEGFVVDEHKDEWVRVRNAASPAAGRWPADWCFRTKKAAAASMLPEVEHDLQFANAEAARLSEEAFRLRKMAEV